MVGVRNQNLVLVGNGTDGTDEWANGTNDGTVNVTVEDLDVTDLNERQVWIMAMVDRGTEVLVSMVVERFRCSVRTAKRDLEELKDKDLTGSSDHQETVITDWCRTTYATSSLIYASSERYHARGLKNA